MTQSDWTKNKVDISLQTQQFDETMTRLTIRSLSNVLQFATSSNNLGSNDPN